jgi:C4-type Zn-finger protein
MDWLWLIFGVAEILLLWRIFPDLFAPRCPICGARLQPHERTHTLFQWHDWETCWHNYICPQCLFRQDYLRIVQKSKDSKYETRTVH